MLIMTTSMNKRKRRQFPDMIGAKRYWKMVKRHYHKLPTISCIDSLQVLPCCAALLVLVLGACTSNHYFSINADEMTNPRIEYHDSTNVTNPF